MQVQLELRHVHPDDLVAVLRDEDDGRGRVREGHPVERRVSREAAPLVRRDRKSTRLNSSH